MLQTAKAWRGFSTVCKLVVSIAVSISMVGGMALAVPIQRSSAYAEEGAALVAAEMGDSDESDVSSVRTVQAHKRKGTETRDPFSVEYTDYGSGHIALGKSYLYVTDPDDHGVVFWFITIPNPEKADKEMKLTYIDTTVPKGSLTDVVIPGFVEVESADGSLERYVVTEIGPEAGVESSSESGYLAWWYKPQRDYVPDWAVRKQNSSGMADKKQPSDSDYIDYAIEHPLMGHNGTNTSITAYGVGGFQVDAVKKGLVANENDTQYQTEPLAPSTIRSLRVPASVETIGSGCFSGWSMASVDFGGNSRLLRLGARAFGNCSNLTSLSLPAGVTAICEPACYRKGMDGEGRTLSGTTPYTDEDYGKWTNETGELSDLPVPIANQSGGATSPINGCSSLGSLSLQSGTKIGTTIKTFFAGCASLQSITVHGAESSLSFWDRDSGSTYEYVGTTIANGIFLANDGSKIEYILPAMEKIEIPDSVKKIENSTFGGSNRMSNAKYVTLGTGITIIPQEAFKNNDCIESLVIKGNATLAGSAPASFQGCKNLKLLDLGPGIDNIPQRALMGCLSLETLVIGCTSETFTMAAQNLITSSSQDKDADTALQNATNTLNADRTLRIYLTGRANEFVTSSNKKYGLGVAFSRDSKSSSGQCTKAPCIAANVVVYGSNAQLFVDEAMKDNTKVTGTIDQGGPFYLCNGDAKNVTFSVGTIKSFNRGKALSESAELTYSGVPMQPSISVTDDDEVAVDAKDYAIEFDNAVARGSYDGEVVGKGDYFGSKLPIKLVIQPADISKADVSAVAEQTATGEKLEPGVSASIVLTDDGEPVALTADDYDLEYEDNVLPGEGKVKLVGKGNYTGEASTTFKIVASEADAAAAKAVDDAIAAIGTVRYDGASKAAIDAAGQAYDALTDVQKAIVSKHGDLEAASARYAELEASARAAARRAAEEKAEREAAEKAAAEKAAQEAAEKAAQEAAEKAAREEAERKAAEEAAKAASTGEDVKAVAADGTQVVADVSDGGTAKLTKVEDASGAVTVSTVTTADGTKVPVTEIAAGAFAGTDVESVKVGASVETIGAGAFKDADSLKSVTVGSGVETIGKNAFAGCDSLETVKLGKSVATIGAGAFEGCKSLESVTVPASTTSIGKGAFAGCDNLETVKLGKSVATIGAGAFEGCKSLESVTVPASTTSIGKGAFKGCAKLSSAKLGKNVKSVAAGAFSGAKKLKTLTISTAKLTKASCKSMLKGSSVKTIKLTGMTKAAKKKAIAKYKKWFPAKVAGKKLVIK